MAELSKRGFAAMDREKQRQIASKGGKAAHAKGTAHHFTPEEARVAGRKGGQAAHAKGTAHEFTSEEARAAGRKGGQRSQTPTNGEAAPVEGPETESGNATYGTAHPPHESLMPHLAEHPTSMQSSFPAREEERFEVEVGAEEI
jgi:general stress protein YciG